MWRPQEADMDVALLQGSDDLPALHCLDFNMLIGIQAAISLEYRGQEAEGCGEDCPDAEQASAMTRAHLRRNDRVAEPAQHVFRIGKKRLARRGDPHPSR